MRYAIRRFFIVSVFLFVTLFPLALEAYVIRLWVMPNEPVTVNTPADPAVIQKFVDDAGKKGVFIENRHKDLNRSGNPDWPSEFSSNVVRQRELVSQLEDYLDKTSGADAIHLEFLRWTDAYHRFSALAGRHPPESYPDIIQMGSTWTATFAQKGVIVPLGKDFVPDDFFPGAVTSTKIAGDDKSYAVPWFIDVRLLYYWKKYFPGGLGSLKTWENFRDSLTRIKEVEPFALTTGATWNLLHNLAPWVWAAGGDFVDTTFMPRYYRAPINSREFKAAVEFLYSLSVDNLLSLPQESNEELELDFVSGRVASVFSTSDLINRMPPGWKTDVGLALPPAGPNGSHPFLGGSHLAVTKFAGLDGNGAECRRLIKFLTNPENTLRYARATGFLPPSANSLATYLSGRPELAVFREALNAGRSYPAIPEWGEIFENEITNNHLSGLWNDIAAARPKSAVFATLADISHHLNLRLKQKAAMHYLPYIGVIVAGIFAALAVFIWRQRRRHGRLKLQILLYTKQISELTGRRTVLEGEIALLKKLGSDQDEKLAAADLKFGELTSAIDILNKKLGELKNRWQVQKPDKMPSFSINWEGLICIGGRELRFDNARQATRLIEYVARRMEYPHEAIHCIKGFTIFDWDGSSLRSQPKRLFDTAISKVNTVLRKNCLPPVLVSSGRKSWSWDIEWKKDFLKGMSDISKAREAAINARALWQTGSPEEGMLAVCEALRLDPKCIEAYAVLHDHNWEGMSSSRCPTASVRAQVETGRQKLEAEVLQVRRGVGNASRYIEALELSGDAETAEKFRKELDRLKAEADYEANIIKSVFGPEKEGRPLYLTEIIRRLDLVWGDIKELRARGLANYDIWAEVTQGNNFMSLLSVPEFNSLVHNFYDYGTKALEDPRLVKLAVLLMLGKNECIDELKEKRDGREFFRTIEKHMRRQFSDLERELSFASLQV